MVELSDHPQIEHALKLKVCPPSCFFLVLVFHDVLSVATKFSTVRRFHNEGTWFRIFLHNICGGPGAISLVLDTELQSKIEAVWQFWIGAGILSLTLLILMPHICPHDLDCHYVSEWAGLTSPCDPSAYP